MFRRATLLRETHPYPSWLRYCLSKVVSTSASEYRADVRATALAQVRGECSFGARRDSRLAQLGPRGWPEELRLEQCKLKTRSGMTPGPAVPGMLKKNAKRGAPALTHFPSLAVDIICSWRPSAQSVMDC